ncbi:MAG: RNA polymerase sigma factor [Mycobacteriales bacterium]
MTGEGAVRVCCEAYPDWQAIYADNVGRVYRLLYAKVGNRPDAEDLTSEVFLAALRPLRPTASAPEVRAYLLATARTVLAAHWRRTLGRQVTTIALDEDFPDDGPAPAEPAGGRAGPRGRVAAILAALPERYRQVLELRFLRAYSVRETAAALGVTAANAKVLQHRALRMAAALDPADEPEEEL